MFGTYDDPDGCATSYACFAETIMNAVHRDADHHVGAIDSAFVRLTRQRFAAAGYAHAAPRMFGADLEQLLVRRRAPA